MTRLRKLAVLLPDSTEPFRISVWLFKSLTVLRSDGVRIEVLLLSSVELSRELARFWVEVETWILFGDEDSVSVSVELIKADEFISEPGVGIGNVVW